MFFPCLFNYISYQNSLPCNVNCKVSESSGSDWRFSVDAPHDSELQTEFIYVLEVLPGDQLLLLGKLPL